MSVLTRWRVLATTACGTFGVVAALLLVPMAPVAAFPGDGLGGAVPKATPKAKVHGDRTVLAKAKKSKKFRSSIPRAEWVVAPHAKYVAKRESGGNCRAVNPNGLYRGKWQMGAPFWSAYGGKKYASRPDLASCKQQDKVAYRGWVASWWHPWGG